MIKIIILSLSLFISMFSFSQAATSNVDSPYSKEVNKIASDFFKLLYSTNAEEISQLEMLSPKEKEIILNNTDQSKIEKIITKQKQIYIQQLNSLSNNGDNSATLALFDWLINNDRDNLAHMNIEPLKILADQNNAQANFLMAELYKDSNQYLNFLEKSANAGYFTAQMALANEYGFRLPDENRNMEKALFWAKKAEETVGPEMYKEVMCSVADCAVLDIKTEELKPENIKPNETQPEDFTQTAKNLSENTPPQIAVESTNNEKN